MTKCNAISCSAEATGQTAHYVPYCTGCAKNFGYKLWNLPAPAVMFSTPEKRTVYTSRGWILTDKVGLGFTNTSPYED